MQFLICIVNSGHFRPACYRRSENSYNRSLTNLLNVRGDFLLDLLVSRLVVWRLGGVHLVDADDQLFDAECEG